MQEWSVGSLPLPGEAPRRADEQIPQSLARVHSRPCLSPDGYSPLRSPRSRR